MKRALAIFICTMLFAATLILLPEQASAKGKGSSYAALSGITVTAGKLDHKFSAKRTAYKLTLAEADASVTVTPAKADPADTVTIDGMAAESVTAELQNGGKKTVKIQVTAPGKKSRTYTVKIARAKSTNCDLAGLTASAGALDKPFDPAALEYQLKLDAYTPTVVIEAAKSVPLSVLKIDGSQTAKKTYSLNPGEKRTVKITVRAQSGATRTYKVRIARDPNTVNSQVEALFDFAKHYLGTPYIRGGKGPDSFDCSGFVYYCLKGIGLPQKYMTSAAWAKSEYTTLPALTEMVPGDILCFKGHVGIYLGENTMIDCVPSAGGVRIASCATSYWTESFISGKRVLAAN
jgi:cell wall-associated NlpC family hydrolase